MLVKRDFEVPPIRPDEEAQGLGTGTSWMTRVKGIALRRGANVRVTCATTHLADLTTRSEPRDTKIADPKVSLAPIQSEQHRENNPQSPALQDVVTIHDDSLAATSSDSRDCTRIDPLYKRVFRGVSRFLLSLLSPPAIACLLSLVIALVPLLKALFVADVPGVNVADAPDGLPPLEWILDIAIFGGSAGLAGRVDVRWGFCADGIGCSWGFVVFVESSTRPSCLVSPSWLA